MTLAIASGPGQRRQLGWGLAWTAGFAVALALYLLRDQLPWATTYPAAWIIPVASWINWAAGGSPSAPGSASSISLSSASGTAP